MRTLSIQVLSYAAYDDLTQFIYLPAGIRLLAVAIFGWIGILGITVGWFFCYIFFEERNLLECIYLGLLSGSTAYVALLFWQWCFNINDALEGLTSRLAIALVLISAAISALIRYMYLNGVDPSIPFMSVFLVGLCGDILGTFIVLYAIKGIVYLLKRCSIL